VFRKKLPAYPPCLIVLLAMAAPVAASAQYQHAMEQSGKGATAATLTAQFVKTGLYFISGGGGNSVLRLSGNGLILVDGKLSGNYDALRVKVKKISDQPIRVLINTDHHENHTGTNAKFLAAGTGIIAHENVKQNLTNYNPPGGKVAPPTVTYDHEYRLRLGGVEAQLMHFGNAVTDGDTVVYFPNLKVVAVGDLFAPAPDPDFSAGGSLVGWGPVLAQVLKLEFDVVVPGTGPTVGRTDLEAFKTKIDTLVSRASALVKRGVPKDQLMAQLKTDDLGWQLSFTGDQLDRFYAELSGMK
jgi:glyoxylase-like metal-dependent hydrolase (beta-lactamase superfamily II)